MVRGTLDWVVFGVLVYSLEEEILGTVHGHFGVVVHDRFGIKSN